MTKRLIVLPYILLYLQGYGQIRIDHIDSLDNYEMHDNLEVKLSNKTIYHPAIFRWSNFSTRAFFDRTEFRSEANFLYANFFSEVYFFHTKFDSVAAFFNTKFDSMAFFKNAEFHSEVYFEDSEFDSTAFFKEATFDSLASFRGSKFHSKAYFQRTKFGTVADFARTEFRSDADFERAEFNFKTDFKSASFNNLKLTYATLPDTLIFEGLSTNEVIDLTKTGLNSSKTTCYINLIDAPIEKIKLRYAKFRVYIPDSITPVIYEQLTNVYEGLLKNFKDNGYLTSYETLDKEYQEFKYTKNPDGTFIGRILNTINKYWNDYGYHKEWVWVYSFAFFLLFTLINWLRFPYLIGEVYSIPSIEKAFKEDEESETDPLKGVMYPMINFRFPLMAFYYTAFIFFGLRISIEKLNFKKPLSISLLFFEYIVGLICLAYLANFVISTNLIGG